MIAPTIPYGATNTIYGCPGTITIGTDEPHLATEEWEKKCSRPWQTTLQTS